LVSLGTYHHHENGPTRFGFALHGGLEQGRTNGGPVRRVRHRKVDDEAYRIA
jgi:hypothetical protein